MVDRSAVSRLVIEVMAQDYIMRLVEQIGRMLSAILAHQKAGRDQEAALEIEATCLQTTGLPFDLVQRSSPEALWDLLSQSGAARYTRAIMLAELLLQDAILCKKNGRPAEALRSQLQAFCLLADSPPVLSPDEAALYRPKVDALAAELASASSDPYLQGKLAAYGKASA